MIEIKGGGPVFDARGPAILRSFADELGEAVADEGVNTVRAEFAKVVQHPTGRYSRSIHEDSYGSRHVISDGNMIYGPWLAGVGSRNKRSRFKGYAHWRRAVQLLERRVPETARKLTPRVLGRLR